MKVRLRDPASGTPIAPRVPAVVLGFPAMVRAAFLGQTEGLPLRNPIGAFPLAIGLQLRFHVIQLRFIRIGSLIELELCKTLFQNGLDMVDGVSFQEIQDHGIGHDELTVDGLRVVREPVRDGAEVDVRRRRDHDETHVIFPASSPRPASCWISLTVSSMISRSLRTLDWVITTVRAGKSTPAARVVVAKTASRHP